MNRTVPSLALIGLVGWTASEATAQTPAQFTQLPTFGLVPVVVITYGYAIGDVDGDGDDDVVAANGGPFSGSTNVLHINDGFGRLWHAPPTQFPVDPWASNAVVLGDVDADGDLDVLFGSQPSGGTLGGVALYVNDGSGRFVDVTAAQMPRLGVAMGTVALGFGDVDGDGDPDVVVGNNGLLSGFPEVYLNDGSGRFTPGPTPLPLTLGLVDLVLGDVDGDGDLDLAVAVLSGAQLYVNDGAGNFSDQTSVRLPSSLQPSCWSVALVDVDGDGDLDTVLGQDMTFTPPRPDRLLLNDGRGVFTDATLGRLPFNDGLTNDVVAADVDADGDQDLLLGTVAAPAKLYVNDGNGFFTDVTTVRFPNPGTNGQPYLAVGDLDQDGDPEIAFAGGLAGRNAIYWNRHRHAHAAVPPAIGASWRLDFHARPGYAAAPQSMLPLVSLGRLQPRPAVPPLGVLALDPSRLAVLAPVAVPAPAGHATAALPIPNAPALRGVALFVQAIAAHSGNPLDWRFTNLHADGIR